MEFESLSLQSHWKAARQILGPLQRASVSDMPDDDPQVRLRIHTNTLAQYDSLARWASLETTKLISPTIQLLNAKHDRCYPARVSSIRLNGSRIGAGSGSSSGSVHALSFTSYLLNLTFIQRQAQQWRRKRKRKWKR